MARWLAVLPIVLWLTFVQAVDASVENATETPAGSKVVVQWTGPNGSGDFIAVDKPDDAERTYGPYAYPSAGNPVQRIGGERRIDLAKQALIDVIDDVLSPGDYTVRLHDQPAQALGNVSSGHPAGAAH